MSRGFLASLLGLLAVGVLIGAGVVAIADIGDEPPQVQRGMSVGDVVERAEDLVGQEITVTGRVDFLTSRALTLGREDLVVAPTGPGVARLEERRFGPGDLIQATGTLAILDAAALRERLGGPSVLPTQFQGFDRGPVLIAERLEPAGTNPTEQDSPK